VWGGTSGGLRAFTVVVNNENFIDAASAHVEISTIGKDLAREPTQVPALEYYRLIAANYDVLDTKMTLVQRTVQTEIVAR
jgi:hypothetical protein